MLVIKYLSLSILSWYSTVNPIVMEQAKADFKKANETFMQGVFSVNMTYNFYKQIKDVKPFEVKTGQYYKNGETSYSKISGIESIRTKNSIIAIQEEEKIVVVNNAAKKTSDLTFSPDSLLKFCSNIIRTEIAPTFVKYELIFNSKIDAEFERIDIVIDKKNDILSKMTMFYKEQEVPDENEADKTETLQPKMEVIYKNYSKTLTINKTIFLEENYVKLLSPNKYKGVGKYSGYKIYNQKFK